MDDDDDPYAAFSYQCKISSSQENLLQLKFSALESQAAPDYYRNITKPSSSSPPSKSDQAGEFPVQTTTGIQICSHPIDNNVELTTKEDVAAKTLESSVEKNLGFLKDNSIQKRARQTEDLGHNLTREEEGCSSKVIKVDLGHQNFGEAAECSKKNCRRVAEDLPSRDQLQAIKFVLDASSNQTSRDQNNVNSMETNPQTRDILEVAAQAGLKFPRPRWWRPEGYQTR